MNTFRLIVSSPDGSLYDGQAEMLALRGAGGDLAILAGHAAFVTAVQPGRCRIICPDGSERAGTTDGGILTVADNQATLLTSSFVWEPGAASSHR